MRRNTAKRRPSRKLRKFVIDFECGGDINRYLTAYWDSIGGVWTIGAGHTKGVYRGMQITPRRALELLDEDLEEYAGYVRENITAKTHQREFDALTAGCMNLGPGYVTPANSTLARELNRGNYARVPDEIVRWDKGGSPPRPVPGLTRRRWSERDIWVKGDYKPRAS